MFLIYFQKRASNVINTAVCIVQFRAFLERRGVVLGSSRFDATESYSHVYTNYEIDFTCMYLHTESHNDAQNFINSGFLIKLAYLRGVFNKLNRLNKSLQGNNTHILHLADKITGFQKIKKLTVSWFTRYSTRKINRNPPSLLKNYVYIGFVFIKPTL